MTSPRTFAIADIHGCCRTFRTLLSALSLQKADTLYLLGDYIDRGLDSRGVVDTILRLQLEGYDIRPIRGNHEEMLLTACATGRDEDLWYWLQNGGDKTLKSYGVPLPHQIPRDHLAFFASLPLYHTTATHVLVHAGLDFDLADPLSAGGAHAMLWDSAQRFEPAKLPGRKLVVGHAIRGITEIIESLGTTVITLDNGCYQGNRYPGRGGLVALELGSNKLCIQENRDTTSLFRRWYDARALGDDT